MASFLSQPQQFTTPQDPFSLELYTQVGITKQQMYNENVARVQGYIDNIAGLQVARPQDKQYIQNKLGELNNQLSGLAGADFSKQQVVNTAGGYAAQIYNDPTIQNSVASAYNYGKYQESKKQAYKDGKGSVTNDYYTDRVVNEWMNNPEAGASLDSLQYKEYYDDTKGFQDWIKDINPTITVEESPMSRNPDGTPNWTAYALVEGKRVEISKDEIMRQAQFYYSSNPLAAQQLDINATYYADHNPTDLNTLRSDVERTNQVYNSELSKLQEKKNITNGDTREIDDKIGKLEIERDTYQKSMARLLNTQDANLIKKEMYKQNVFTSLADRFDRLEVNTKINSNPIFQAQMEEAKFKQHLAEFNWDKEKFQLEYNQKQQELSLKAAQQAQTGGGQLLVNPTVPEEQTFENIAGKVAALGTEVVANAKAVLNSSGIPSQGMTDEQVLAKMNELHDSYLTDPMGVSVNLREYFQNTTNSQAGYGRMLNYTTKRDQLNTIDQEVRNAPQSQQYLQQLQNIGDPNKIIGRIPIYTSRPGTGRGLTSGVEYSTITGYRDITAADYAEMTRVGTNRKRQVPGGVIWIDSNVKKKIDNFNNKYAKEYTDLRNSRVRSISDATPSVMETYNTKGTEDAKTGQAILNQVTSFLPSIRMMDNGDELADKFENVLAKNKEGFTVSGYHDPIVGGTSVVVTSLEDPSKSASIPLPAGNERLFPQINQTDRQSLIREELTFRNETSNYFSPVDFNQGAGYNLDNYTIRAKFNKTLGGQFYATLEYKDKNQGNTWAKFRETDPVSSIEQVVDQVIKAGQNTDIDLKNKYGLR